MPINYNEYPENWEDLRRQVLERAGQNYCDDGSIMFEAKCEKCYIPNKTVIIRTGKGKNDWILFSGTKDEALAIYGKKPTKIVLTIAHLDHDKDNHNVSIDRLQALCQKCHLGYDLERHIANRKYGRNHNKNNYKLDL